MHIPSASSAATNLLHRHRWLRYSIFPSAHLVLTRHASVACSHHSFPFPARKNPTPHEIFHLPPNASQHEVKARYYELVKVYHPDVSHGYHDVPPSVRNAQFRAITQAYGVLRGWDGSTRNRAARDARDFYESRDEAIRAELRRRARRSRSSSSTTATAANVHHGSVDDAHFRYTLVAVMIFWIITVLSSLSSHMDRVERHSQSAAANLAQARAEARVHGVERRRMIRERVRAFREGTETGTRERASRDV
ncbi:hypothetical protein JVU11DRAFT_6723 [Chiua virens]|nr:hypothetical protein JVU11DRAFT_6723 [Chiua virens]